MEAIRILHIFLLFFGILDVQSKDLLYRCGVDDEKMQIKPATNYVEIDKNHPSYKRRMETEEFKDFHIYLDLVNIKNDIKSFKLEKYESLYINSLTKAAKTLESLLKVKKLSKGYKFTDEQIKNIKIEDWDKTMFGTDAEGDMASKDIDLIIFGRFDDKMSESTLASAGPRYLDQENGRPIVGVVNINSNIEYSKINSEYALTTTLLHEFTHILGFLKDYFQDQFHNMFNKTDGDGVVRYYINSPKVLEVAKKYFNCSSIDGVELEESGGLGTVGSHWEARILLGDYMNGYTYREEEVVSEFTLALLEDSGFYKPNYYTGGLMRYGKGKGCDFVKKKCVNSHEINPLFENEFFDSIESDANTDASCSSGRQSRTYHFFGLYEDIPQYYKYFENEKYGGFSPADFCPVSISSSSEENNTYYIGHCSKMGSGEYGTKINYLAKEITRINTTTYTTTFYYHNKSGDLADITGETFSDNSFCYQSTLIKNGINFNATVARAICYESFCSDRSLTVKIKDDYFVCPRAGGKIEVEGYTGYFLCADYNLICSGTVMCNDLFDCIEKKSETKEESYYYDYTILTSQNLEDAEIKTPDDTNNYELSENGVCPKDCKQCKENKKCIKCRNDYSFVGSTENEEKYCLSQSELSNGYYKIDDIYYKCMPNCDSCKDDKTCDKCSNGFEYSNEKCIKPIENCETYNKEGNCKKCKDNFAFKEENITACLSKEIFENYYTKDNGISYYPCEKEIQNCSKCYYDEAESKAKCYLCVTNFVVLESENKDSCISDSNFNQTFLKINDTHIKKCSSAINNCNECTSEKICTKCENNFYMINDNKTNCIASKYLTDEFYPNDNKTMYYACNNSAYNDILNCKSCSNKESCSLCREEYTFIDGNKSKCIETGTLNNKYIQDPEDKSNFVKCQNVYSNCDTCNSLKCLTCNEDFIIYSDKCVSKTSLPSNMPTNIPTNTPTNKLTNLVTNMPTNIITNAPSDISTNMPTNTPPIYPTNSETQILSNSPNTDGRENDDVEDEISQDIAEKKANITLSFEKINNFIYIQDKKSINFDLSVLTTTDKIKKGDSILVYVNLLYPNGTLQSTITESQCIVQNITESSTSARAKFLCSIENTDNNYYSLRYNYSESISGVPNDEVSLDPVMTKKYKTSNEEKVIPTFTPESINHSSCQSTGILTISGNFTQKLSQLNKFNIPLTYPEGIALSCELNSEQNLIECKVDREIINKTIIIEQTVIKQGKEDYFNLKSIKSKEEIFCSDGVLKDSITKENTNISFRQVSHFEKDDKGFSFYFISLVSEKLDKGKNITINVNTNNEKEEKPVDCILEDSIDPKQGKTQGNFLCSVDKAKNEKWQNVNFENISIAVSSNNDIIGGIDSLDEISANPSKTDDIIKKIKEKKQNNETVNNLTNVVDYYTDNVEVNTLTLDGIDMDSCKTTGKLTFTGSFLNDNEENINFDLPLTYPNVELKCELKGVKKNTKTNIKCKSQTEFKSVKNIVLEPRLIKKKNQELFYIEGKIFNLGKKITCEKYETIKKQIIQKRQSTGIYYALMSKLELVNKIIQFLMILTKKKIDYIFQDKYSFTSDFIFSTRRNLRSLDETIVSDIQIECSLNESLTLNLTGGYNCKSGEVNNQGNPKSLEIDTDKVDSISGIEKINHQSISKTNNIDYSNKDYLGKINSLPEVTIKEINGDTCSENGQYNISGNISDTSNLETQYSNIEISFSSPESIGLCQIEIDKNNKEIKMKCENGEKFDISQIIIDKSLIQDSGGNYIFTINSFSTADQFACDISLNSIKIDDDGDLENSSSTVDILSDSISVTDSLYPRRPRKTKEGLSRGAIAGIVIACVFVIAAVGIVIFLFNKGMIGSKSNTNKVYKEPNTNNVIKIDSELMQNTAY